MNTPAAKTEDPKAQRFIEAFEAYWRTFQGHLMTQCFKGDSLYDDAYVIYLNTQLVESVLPVRSGPLDHLRSQIRGGGTISTSLFAPRHDLRRAAGRRES